MAKFNITIDSSCDGNVKELNSMGVDVICYNYSDGKTEYLDNMDESNNKKIFYNMKNNGAKYSTSQLNQFAYYNFFKEHLGNRKSLLHISLTEGLSGSINQARLAAREIMEEDNSIHIEVIDSLIACNGELVLLDKALEYQKADMTLDEASEKLSEVARNINTYFTTDTLTYFVRGGRLPRIAGLIGNVLKVNPVLMCNSIGNLKVDKQVRGRKNALNYILEQVGNTVVDPEKQDIYICHADNIEGAYEYRDALMLKYHFKGCKIYQMGPIVGAHTGPGLIAIFYLGKERVYKNDRKN